MGAIAQIRTAGTEAEVATVLTTTSATIGVDVTAKFDPEGFSLPGVAKWVDRSGGIAIGYPSLTLSVRPPTKASRVYKVTAKLAIPTLEVTSPSTASGIQPQPTLAYTCAAHVEFLLPERSTRNERTILLSKFMALFATIISASDGVPTDSTLSPLRLAVLDFDPPY